ncbi:MAG TPA: radical SAM protein [Bellilinea sp.]|nr:radical SAM protein [Bellilinea sp.]
MNSGPHRPGRARQAAYILQNYLLTRRKPFLASYKLTYRCNLRCQQCPFFTLESPDPTFAQACNTLDQLYQRGNRMIMFEGGEPMLWHDETYRVHDLVNYARQRFFSVGMTTNGTMPLDVPTDVLWVSIDGLRETHNTLRSAPIFDSVIAHVRASTHPRLFAHVTVNAVNADEIPALLPYLNGIFRGITLQFYYPYNHQDALFLDFERRERLLDQVIQLKHGGVRVLNSDAALQALKRNKWACRDQLIDNANPDGTLQQGCYLKGRADIDCARCGFSPHTEISLACQGNLQAVQAGLRIFM